MDAVSYSLASKQAQRIEKFIENPDSTSGIVTVPKTIASGETVTVPAGRVAVLPNVQVDGTLNIDGEVFIPSGATFDDLESQIGTKQPKSELAYNVDTSSYIPNTLASGAIIEIGSNANGEYIKYADGTLICICSFTATGNVNDASIVNITRTTPASFFNTSGVVSLNGDISNTSVYIYRAYLDTPNTFTFGARNDSGAARVYSYSKALVVGKWK